MLRNSRTILFSYMESFLKNMLSMRYLVCNQSNKQKTNNTSSQRFLDHFYLLNSFINTIKFLLSLCSRHHATCYGYKKKNSMWIVSFKYSCFSSYLSPLSPLFLHLSSLPEESLSDGPSAETSK